MTLFPAGQSYAASPWTHVPDYGDKAASKLGFGLRNALLGWTEIITETIQSGKEKQFFLLGTLEGVAKFVGRTVGGVLHAVTFPVTSLDIPLPENGKNLWPYD